MSGRFKASVSGYGQAVVIDTTVPVTRKGRIVATFGKCDDAESEAVAAHAATHETLEEVVAAIRFSGLRAEIHA